MKDLLVKLYIEAVEDATNWFLSYYCSSQEEKEKRLRNDEEQIEYFKTLIEQI